MDSFPDERRQLIAEASAIAAKMSTMPKASSLRKKMVVRYNEIVSRLTEIKSAVRQFRGDETITDHALIRWLERKHGVDIARLKKIMLTEGLDFAAKSGEKYYAYGNLMYVIDGGAVQTVIPLAHQHGEAP